MSTKENIKTSISAETNEVVTDIVKPRKKHAIYFSDTISLTVQEDAKSSDINNIMQTFLRTGQLPVKQTQQPIFGDFASIPSLETIYNTIKTAKDAFLSLPPDVRALCDNNPQNLAYIALNPENHAILIKHGLMKKRQDADNGTAHDAPIKHGENNAKPTQGTDSNINK